MLSNVESDDLEICFQQSIGAGKKAFVLDVDLRLPGAGTTAIFGESGAGKTTLLRCIAGLQRCQQATLRVAGRTWQDDSTCIPAHQRAVGYVFQQPSLFGHLTAQGNLDFARKRATPGGAVVDFDDTVAMLGIGALLGQRASSLSGGEQQRVAIARALLSRPRLLLLDEPLASLDAARKAEVLPFLENVARHAEIPMLYVSHSVDEVMRLANDVVVMQAGRVKRQGPVAQALGVGGERLADVAPGTILEAELTAFDSVWRLGQVAFAGGSLWLATNTQQIGTRIRVRVLARDVSVTRSAATDSSILNIVPAEIVTITEQSEAPTVMIELAIGPTRLLAEVTRRSVASLDLQAGQSVWAQIKSAAIVS